MCYFIIIQYKKKSQAFMKTEWLQLVFLKQGYATVWSRLAELQPPPPPLLPRPLFHQYF